MADFCVAPGNTNSLVASSGTFVYAIRWNEDGWWSDDAVFRLVASDGSPHRDFRQSDGQADGDLLRFTFEECQPGIQYRGSIIDGEVEIEHFSAVDLCAVLHPGDPHNHLPFPPPRDDSSDADGTSE